MSPSCRPRSTPSPRPGTTGQRQSRPRPPVSGAAGGAAPLASRSSSSAPRPTGLSGEADGDGAAGASGKSLAGGGAGHPMIMRLQSRSLSPWNGRWRHEVKEAVTRCLANAPDFFGCTGAVKSQPARTRAPGLGLGEEGTTKTSASGYGEGRAAPLTPGSPSSTPCPTGLPGKADANGDGARLACA